MWERHLISGEVYFESHANIILNILIILRFNGFTKPFTQLHPAPSTSTQLILISTQLHPPSPSSFQSPSSYLQQPQQYLDQNIAHNWAIFRNLDRKIKSYPFFTENWHTWYIGGVDSESRLRILKF